MAFNSVWAIEITDTLLNFTAELFSSSIGAGLLKFSPRSQACTIILPKFLPLPLLYFNSSDPTLSSKIPVVALPT